MTTSQKLCALRPQSIFATHGFCACCTFEVNRLILQNLTAFCFCFLHLSHICHPECLLIFALQHIAVNSAVTIWYSKCQFKEVALSNIKWVGSVLIQAKRHRNTQTYRYGFMVKIYPNGFRQISDDLVLHRDFHHIIDRLGSFVSLLKQTHTT